MGILIKSQPKKAALSGAKRGEGKEKRESYKSSPDRIDKNAS